MTQLIPIAEPPPASLLPDPQLEKVHHMMQDYWDTNPEIYYAIQQDKQLLETKKRLKEEVALQKERIQEAKEAIKSSDTKIDNFLAGPLQGAKLRSRIRESQRDIRSRVLESNSDIVPRTAAHNRKCTYSTIEEERIARGDILAEQLKSWRAMLPLLIKRFSKIPDPRNPSKIKHKITVLMMFGLFAFIFRMKSRREMNRELTGAAINENLRKLFPELNSIPHADTVARLLKSIDPKHIEKSHILLIKDLIHKKKFQKLLIHDCLPISIDGTQKLYRDGLRQDECWLQRTVGKEGDDNKQQYIYTVEANITLKNGLNIPLMTEYLFFTSDQFTNPRCKEDCEVVAFERLAERLKQYFPRLKMIFFMDALYATQAVMGILHNNHWEYIISLPKNKLKDFANLLKGNKELRQPIPHQPYYRKRYQEFYWQNNVVWGYEWQLSLSLVACLERYEEANPKTGDIEIKYSEHCWISSINTTIKNVHELYNLGGRKKELIGAPRKRRFASSCKCYRKKC